MKPMHPLAEAHRILPGHSGGWADGRGRACPARRMAFTLVELMVVVAIMGIIMTMAMPAMYRRLHPDSMQKAVTDIMEACSHARAQAILSDVPTELQIRPQDRTIRVSAAAMPPSGSALFDAGSGGASRTSPLYSPSGEGGEGGMQDLRSTAKAPMVANFSVKLSDQVKILLLDVNFFEYKDEELAQVRFYPNGTSDEFTIVLSNDHNEWRKITLEVVTALATVETDPNKWLR